MTAADDNATIQAEAVKVAEAIVAHPKSVLALNGALFACAAISHLSGVTRETFVAAADQAMRTVAASSGKGWMN